MLTFPVGFDGRASYEHGADVMQLKPGAHAFPAILQVCPPNKAA